jgi:hypothetical protein
MARSEVAQPFLSLDDYRKQMRIPICAFNGVRNPSEQLGECDDIWTQAQRDEVAQALADAESLLAQQQKFWIGARYLVDTGLVWRNPMQLKWGYIVGPGIRARDEVTPSASDFTTDPATITVPQASFSGGTSEIVVIEDSTGLEIEPDSIASSGANYVLSIDQCKLIEWDDLENQIDEITYNAAFPASTWLKLADLTVYRQYRDETTQAVITYASGCHCFCNTGDPCAGTEATGCVFVLNDTISQVRINRATESGGSWSCDFSAVCTCSCNADKVQVSYLAGTSDDSEIGGWQKAIRSLAHTMIFSEICSCSSLFDRQLRMDTAILDDPTRAVNPWGPMNGAWWAWNWMRAEQIGTAILLG